MDFGEQVKKIRKDRDLTQQDMADLLNVSRQAVSNWENDKNLPDIEMLITMAQVFQLTLDELILGDSRTNNGGTKMNNMTEKLIQDGSINARIKMNLLGIKIGGALLALGFISLLVGIFAPPSMENYFGIAFGAMMVGGVITFLVAGLKNAVDLFKNREQPAQKQKVLLGMGGILVLAGILAYGVSLATGVISGAFGILGMVAGAASILAAMLTSKS